MPGRARCRRSCMAGASARCTTSSGQDWDRSRGTRALRVTSAAARQIAAQRLPPLHVRAILFVVLVCAMIIGLDSAQLWNVREARLQQARTETANLARSLAQHAEDVFESADATLKGLRATLIEDGSVPATVASLARRMRTRVANQAPILQRLFIYDENGNWVASSLDASAFDAVRTLNYTDRDYFRYHRDHANDVALIGPPIQTKLNGDWVITLTRRINRPGGSFGGVVGASLPLEMFQRFFQSFDIGARGAIVLSSSQGVLLVRRPFDEANVGRSIATSAFFQGIREDAETGDFAFASALDGEYRIGNFHRVPGFGLIMIVALDQTEVLSSWRHDTQIHVLWMTFIVAGVGLAGYQITVQIRRRAAAEARLVASQQTLENRVIERTAALQQTVAQRDLLLREVYHRVNNNMQSVDALLAKELKHLSTQEARQPLLDMRTRVSTLGLAHQQLMTAADLETFDIAPFLRELAYTILSPAADRGIILTVDAVSVTVKLDFAVPFGLLTSEIIALWTDHTPLTATGRIAIRLWRNNADNVVLAVSADRLAPAPLSKRDPGKTARRERFIAGMIRQINGVMTARPENTWDWEVVFTNPETSN